VKPLKNGSFSGSMFIYQRVYGVLLINLNPTEWKNDETLSNIDCLRGVQSEQQLATAVIRRVLIQTA
jgi:hypothetical protein